MSTPLPFGSYGSACARHLMQQGSACTDHQRRMLCERLLAYAAGGKGLPSPLHPRPGASPLGTPN